MSRLRRRVARLEAQMTRDQAPGPGLSGLSGLLTAVRQGGAPTRPTAPGDAQRTGLTRLLQEAREGQAQERRA